MNILSIGGSDPSAGAGIQADIKTISSLNGYCCTVITAITSQNTSQFSQVTSIDPSMIKSQIDLVFSDINISAVKIGMVYNSGTIKAIYSKIKDRKIPVVVDPVIKSTTGGVLLKKEALSDYKKLLVPLADVITPNRFEAETLSDMKIRSEKGILLSANKIRNLGGKNVVITGIKKEKNKISDFVLENSNYYFNTCKKLSKENHGGGCTFSAALTFYLAIKKNLHDATKLAQKYSFSAIKNSQLIGKGIPITNLRKSALLKILEDGIERFVQIKKIYTLIPECQTNFVLAKKNPKSLNDVLGVQGRLVKSGNLVIMAGSIEYGGSQHVATAILAINKKFPSVRSALNIKYDNELIRKFKENGYLISSYNRRKEPPHIQRKENSTISWGINHAISGFKKPPDVIYHRGGFGKEPMILVFGKQPTDVVDKITKIIKA